MAPFRAGRKIYMAARYAWRDNGGPEPGELTASTRCVKQTLPSLLLTGDN